MEPAAGLEIERYRLLRLLGVGGMGQVWLARDVKLGRKVALKLLRADRSDEGWRHALLLEAQAMAKLSHPHIVTVYASGEWEGRTFIALEYLEGPTLRERLAAGLAPKEAIRIGAHLASALEAAHARSLVHGDVKPENAVVPEDGRVRLVDFGLVHRTGEWVDAHEGTAAYLAPERTQSSTATAASDVFALGVTVHELLTGRRPAPDVDATLEPKLREVLAACLQRDPASRPPAGVVASSLLHLLDARIDTARLPFRSLRAFGVDDEALFFGRDAEAQSLVERLRRAPLVSVIGPSGVGKSSLVQAGLVPRLREAARWRVVTVRPGARPLRALAEALCEGRSAWQAQPTLEANAPPPAAPAEGLERALRETPARLARELATLAEGGATQVLLVVDQGEEALTHSPQEATAFFGALAHTVEEPHPRVRVVLCLREEFLGPAVRWAGAPLGDIVVLNAIESTRLVQTLEGPLALVGHRFEDERLATEMVNAVSGSPSALPLLQFCAAKLWDARDVEHRVLRRNAFVALGGVVGALVHHADAVLAGLTAEELSWARTLFMRAVTEYGTRRVNSERLLLEGLPAGAAQVLARLVEGRLLVARRQHESDEPQFELAHEALLSEWTRLKRWREEDGERTARMAELRDRAARWEQRGRTPLALLPGAEALEAARLAAGEPLEASSRAFVDASVSAQRSALRTRRALVGSALVVLTVFVVVLLGLWRRSTDNEAAARRAEARALLETAVAAEARLDPFEARARARRAMELSDDVAVQQTWFQLERSPLRDGIRTDGPVWEVSFSADGEFLAMAREANDVLVVNLRTHERRLLQGHQAEVVVVEFDPSGRWLLSADHLGEVRLWAWPQGTSVVLGQHRSEVYSLAFSPDGRFAASGSLDRRVLLYDVAGARVSREWELDTVVLGVAFAGDGALLATSPSRKLWALEPVDGGVRIATAVQSEVTSVTVVGDGGWVVTAGNDATARVFELASGEQRVVTRAHVQPISEVTSWGTSRFATTSTDGTARVFELSTGQELEVFGPYLGALYDVAAKGSSLALADGDGVAWVVDTSERARDGLDHGQRGPLRFVAASRSGPWVATTGDEPTLRVWSAEGGLPLRVFRAGTKPLRTPSFSADGRWVAAGSNDGRVYVFGLTDAAPRVLEGSPEGVNALSFAPHGAVLAFGGRDGQLRVVDLDDATGTVRGVKGHGTSVEAVAWSADGQTLASASLGGELAWWRAPSLELLERRQLSAGFQTLAFLDDGTLLATTDSAVLTFDAKRVALQSLRTEMLYDAQLLPQGRVLLARSSGDVLELELASGSTRVLASGRPAHAVTRTADGRWLVWGDEDGTLHRVPWESLPKLPAVVPHDAVPDVVRTFSALPASTPTRLLELPSEVLALGFETGDVGLWSRDGRLLTLEHVHGPVVELVVERGVLVVRSTEDRLLIPLGALLETRAQLLQRFR
ncbi:MAG: protein kinase [Archangium sp.]